MAPPRSAADARDRAHQLDQRLDGSKTLLDLDIERGDQRVEVGQVAQLRGQQEALVRCNRAGQRFDQDVVLVPGGQRLGIVGALGQRTEDRTAPGWCSPSRE